MKRFVIAGLVAGFALLTGCGSAASQTVAAKPAVKTESASPTLGPECARQVRAWLATQVPPDAYQFVSVPLGAKINNLIVSAQNYQGSGSAVYQNGLATWASEAMQYPLPACADPEGNWKSFITDAQAAASATDPPQGTKDVGYMLDFLASLNQEFTQTAPGVQISQNYGE